MVSAIGSFSAQPNLKLIAQYKSQPNFSGAASDSATFSKSAAPKNQSILAAGGILAGIGAALGIGIKGIMIAAGCAVAGCCAAAIVIPAVLVYKGYKGVTGLFGK